MSPRIAPLQVVAVVAVGLLVSGSARDPGDEGNSASASARKSKSADAGADSTEGSAAGPQLVRLKEIPALGLKTRAQLTTASRQAVVVIGDDQDSNQATAMLYERDSALGWQPASAPWPAHNGLHGWTNDHRQGDHRSPIGVFDLTDAGGRLPNPGTKLPYDHAPAFTVAGTGSQGEPLAGSFDYVVAINYNREPGTSPLNQTRPLGESRGGGIWIHVDHDGPTQACISLPKDRMRELLRWLDPAKRPALVMGHVTALSK